MEIGLKVLYNNSQFRKELIKAICAEFTIKLLLISKKVRDDLATHIDKVFKYTNEYDLFMSDKKILGDLGIPKGQEEAYFQKIFNKIAENITVRFEPLNPRGNNSISGGIYINAVIADFSDILAVPEATIQSKRGPNKWLKWLLFNGTSPAVENFNIRFNFAGYVNSRSGFAIMVKNNGSSWSVDGRVSGTENYNWITRALIDNRNIIANILTESINKHLGN